MVKEVNKDFIRTQLKEFLEQKVQLDIFRQLLIASIKN